MRREDHSEKFVQWPVRRPSSVVVPGNVVLRMIEMKACGEKLGAPNQDMQSMIYTLSGFSMSSS